MKVRFSKTFVDYAAAVSWLEANRYDQSVCRIADSGAVTVTLEGAHAVRALEAETQAKVLVGDCR